MTRPFGLDPALLDSAVGALSASGKVRKVLLFGSRARGGYGPGSDIDLAVSAPGLSFAEYLGLLGAVDDLPIVFKIDVVHVEALPPSPLAAQIERDGVVLYLAAAQAA